MVVLWFAAHLLWTGGVEPVSAWFTLAIACLGGALLSWGSWRRPPLGTPDDFVDTNLAGVGRSLVLGAVVIFGFGVVAQQLDDDPAEEHRQDDPATQVRADAGGGVFRDADLSGENLRGLDLRRFDFTGSDLSDARLDDARLARAVLHTADLDEATLDGVGATRTTWPDGFEPVPTEC